MIARARLRRLTWRPTRQSPADGLSDKARDKDEKIKLWIDARWWAECTEAVPCIYPLHPGRDQKRSRCDVRKILDLVRVRVVSEMIDSNSPRFRTIKRRMAKRKEKKKGPSERLSIFSPTIPDGDYELVAV